MQLLAIHRLKSYFAVDGNYVMQKTKVVLAPFTHKQWQRSRFESSAGLQPSLPIQDTMAPDLYLPLMSFVTYALLMGFLHMEHADFHPDQLSVTASSSLVLLFLEVMILKGGYLLIAPVSPNEMMAQDGPSLLDFVSYSCYKYIPFVFCSS